MVHTRRLVADDQLLGRRAVILVRICGVVLGVLLAIFPSVAAAGPATPQQAVAFLNAQRAANGIPGDIVENSDWSAKCRAHMDYIAKNGGTLTHDEVPENPGYTTDGAWAGQNSVLSSEGYTDRGNNPWEYAPIHLIQMLAPALNQAGSFDGCFTTWPGYLRTSTSQELFTYPGAGTSNIYYSETARESPFVPGDFVGLPAGTTTGPHIFVLYLGPGSTFQQRGAIQSASLSGPSGPVAIKTVDNATASVGGYMPAGGMMIPVQPLAINTTYTAQVTFKPGNAAAVTTLWSLTTTRKDPNFSGYLDSDGVGADSDSPVPIQVTIHRSLSNAFVQSLTVTPGKSRKLRLPGANYTACFDQPATDMYASTHLCETSEWSGPLHPRIAAARLAHGRVRFTLRSPKKLDRSKLRVTIRRVRRTCRYDYCYDKPHGKSIVKRLTLKTHTRFTVRARGHLRVLAELTDGVAGDFLYAGTTTRTFR